MSSELSVFLSTLTLSVLALLGVLWITSSLMNSLDEEIHNALGVRREVIPEAEQSGE